MKMKSKAAALACLFVLLVMSACAPHQEGEETGAWDYKPMIFVEDTLYEDIGHLVDDLPEGAMLLGTVEKLVPQSEPMVRENFCANAIPVGSALYRNETEPTLLYVDLGTGGGKGYSVFQTMEEEPLP